jgi:TetR/AcrR family transcriptional repressor of nem operon
MAAERDDLPPEVRTEVDRFADINVQWLTEVLVAAKRPGTTRKTAQRQALAIYAAIQGAQLVARGRANVAVYDQSIEAFRIAGLIP